MRVLFLLCLCLLSFSGMAIKPATARPLSAVDSVVIEKRKLVIIRPRKFVKDFPGRKRAVITYPFIKSGGSNAAVLRKVRSLLQIKNIFDSSVADYRESTWLDEFDYQVNYNRNFILDITFSQNGVAAYPDGQSKTFTISLKTGEIIKAKDIFRADALNTLVEMINVKLQAEIKENQAGVAQQTDITAEDKTSLQEQLAGLKFKREDLDEFSITDKGITFLYDAGFPHVIQAIEPVGQYFFTYSELRSLINPAGPVGTFTR